MLKRKNVVEQKYNKKEICTYLDFGKNHKNTKVKPFLMNYFTKYDLSSSVPMPGRILLKHFRCVLKKMIYTEKACYYWPFQSFYYRNFKQLLYKMNINRQ